MANDVIRADAQAVRIAAIENRGGCRTLGADVIPGHGVEIEGDDAGDNMGGEHIQHLGSEAAGAAHALIGCGAVQADMTFGRFDDSGSLVHGFQIGPWAAIGNRQQVCRGDWCFARVLRLG